MKEVISIIDNFNQVSLHDPSEEILEVYKHIPEINELDPRGFPMCRPLFSHSDVPSFLKCINIDIKDFDWDSEFVYSVMLHHNNPLAAKHLDLIPAKIQEQIKLKKCKLILDNTLEGNPVELFFDEIYKSIIKLNLPSEQIYYVTNNLFAEEVSKEYNKKRSISNPINVISFMYNVKDVQRLKRLGELPQTVDIQKEFKYKKKNISTVKHALKLNRTGRPERNLLMLHINKNEYYNKINLSFPEYFPVDNYNENFKSITDRNNIDSLKSKIPFDIDETDVTNHGEPGYGVGKFNADLPFQPIHYRNTFFSIVMCAFPYVNACHLHSSTFNPIYCGHPVLQFGPYKHLEELRKRGFITFNRWWDESYDEIQDDNERLSKVLEIVDNLLILPKEQLLDMYEEMIPILQHNSDLIQNYDIKFNLIDRIL